MQPQDSANPPKDNAPSSEPIVATASVPAQDIPPFKYQLTAGVVSGILSFGIFFSGLIAGMGYFSILLAPLALAPLFFKIQQDKYLRRFINARIVTFQNKMLLFTAAAFADATLIGDLHGARTFSDSPEINSPADLLSLVAFTLLLTMYILTIFVFTNTFYIATHGRNKVLNIMGRIGVVIIGLVVGMASYIGYTIMYIAHDPSSE